MGTRRRQASPSEGGGADQDHVLERIRLLAPSPHCHASEDAADRPRPSGRNRIRGHRPKSAREPLKVLALRGVDQADGAVSSYLVDRSSHQAARGGEQPQPPLQARSLNDCFDLSWRHPSEEK